MLRFFYTRVGYAVVSLFVLTLTVFLLTRLTGDPTLMLLEPGASAADIAALRTRLGLDHSLPVQFWFFVVDALQGDFGTSIYHGMPVIDLYLERLPNSLMLAGLAFIWSLALGLACGVLAALYANTRWDHAIRFVALGGLAMPPFWLGMLLVLFFSVRLDWLPSSGDGGWANFVMPVITLGWYFSAAYMRLTRSSMLEVLSSDYVKLARLKGLRPWTVIMQHAFRNAVIPVLTLAAINLVSMVNSAVVVETLFAWPGIGRLLYEGISFRDFPVIQTTVLLSGVMIILVNLLADLLSSALDPRIRL
ncbi:ABC transporter permease [Pigmentiphaga aceris]|uniref:ABC transporter permease n=1 Tax=Pigmentiphaga aceris TaxID=1940612 RepID=A0A5C0AWC1_9BURK|nr:ABC transporter permease [Pigmentiphaga aceris]QEI06608.1 ABC transporter permease [Pigmentiphaga aceris]